MQRRISRTRIVLIAGSLSITPLARADLQLSAFLGVPAGSAASGDRPPFVRISAAPDGVGADCPGSWSSSRIQFGDVGVQSHGIGQRPPQGAVGALDFDLNAVRAATGRRRFAEFRARVGIERFSQPSAGANGSTFAVRVNGNLASLVNVQNGSSPSVNVRVPIAGAQSLALETTQLGERSGNNACWGEAELIETPCPGDLDDGLAFGLPDGAVTIDDLVYFLLRFEEGAPSADLDDGSKSGTLDGGVDINDLVFFLVHFEAGC